MTQRKVNRCGLIAGILFVVWMVQYLWGMKFSSDRSGSIIVGILFLLHHGVPGAIIFLPMIGNLIIAVSMLFQKRNLLAGSGFIILFVHAIIIGTVANGSWELGDFIRLYNPQSFLLKGLAILAYALATLICVLLFTNVKTSLQNLARKLWFLPVALLVPLIIYNLICFLNWCSWARENLIGAFGASCFTYQIFSAAIVFVAMQWVAYPDGLPCRAKKSAANENDSALGEMYCGLVKHILLLLFTFGIWFLIWIYRVTAYTNHAEGEEDRNPTTKLLLCIFVPFYRFYWTYKTAQRIDKMAAAKSIPSDLPVMCLILEIFVPIIPPILMQDKLNKIVCGTPVQVAITETEQMASGTIKELKGYKELLDSGILTQEEFDAKKKQLLGL